MNLYKRRKLRACSVVIGALEAKQSYFVDMENMQETAEGCVFLDWEQMPNYCFSIRIKVIEERHRSTT